MGSLIVTGGTRPPVFLLEEEAKRADLIIASDRGYNYLTDAGIAVDIAVGDFDSLLGEELKAGEIYRHKSEKDETDTELALSVALEKGHGEMTLLGAWGSRWDHSLANIFLLEQIQEKGGRLTIKDENNVLFLAAPGSYTLEKDKTYVSLLPLSPWVEYSTENFAYEVHHLRLKRGTPRGVSNELLGRRGRLTIHEGMALVFQSQD
ncbi:MAG: thiamine diphosphokinase [Tissierellia bacterium]|nr:thiamine diphosphokinase [Tissierellia bacterium]